MDASLLEALTPTIVCEGTFSYHPLLADFLQRSPDHHVASLPGTADDGSHLPLALVLLYASPSYRQQALQVRFSSGIKPPCGLQWG